MELKDMSHDDIKRIYNKSEQELLEMDEAEFRARFRDRTHHTLEMHIYDCIRSGTAPKPHRADTVKLFLHVWKQRGLSLDLSEYKHAINLVGFFEALIKGEQVDLSVYEPYRLSETEMIAFDNAVHERRSVRHWTDRRVDDALINKILDAGLWAAHSCNLQSIRYLIVREESAPNLFRSSNNISGGPVHLVLLQDTRVYNANPFNPARNRLLDCGAAAQNIVLTAHAFGLGGVWLTFNNDMMRRIREHFSIPDYLEVVTYVDVGYAAQTPAPMLRGSVAENTFLRV